MGKRSDNYSLVEDIRTQLTQLLHKRDGWRKPTRIVIIDPGPVKMSKAYKDHINSDKWKEFRKTILVKYKHTCQKCNNIFLPRDLHVHHLHYRTFGNEKDEDVKLVCVGCHEKIHGRKFNNLT